MAVYDTPTPAPVCPGLLTGVCKIVDVDDSSALPIVIEDGRTIELCSMPETITTRPSVKAE